MPESRTVIWNKLQQRIVSDLDFRNSLLVKLYDRIDRFSETKCWEWMGEKSESGYGLIRLKFGISAFRAHRLMFVAARLELIPDDVCVLHRCDNPPCINPKHLFLGTKMDNTQDALKKNRLRPARLPGELNPSAKLTKAKVDFIRKNFQPRKKKGPYTCGNLARMFSVTNQTIFRIVTRSHWKSD